MAHGLAFSFIAQIEKKLESSPMTQKQLARKLGISEGAVSKFLNNPQNVTLKTAAKYARALGFKLAMVAYEDDDPANEKGLVSSEIFAACWERSGKPRDIWSLQATATTSSPATITTMRLAFYSLTVGTALRAWTAGGLQTTGTGTAHISPTQLPTGEHKCRK